MNGAGDSKMNDLLVYNTLSRKKERFVPRHEGEVSIYVCGITPYDHAHIGHARPSIFFDVVRKFLRAQGWNVRFVQNFTDVDDKIIERAQSERMDPMELSRRFSALYLDAMDRLGVERADSYPKVSEHIPEIIDMIRGLVERDAAYAKDGNVFFKVNSFTDYGKLSGQRKDELIEGGEVEAAEGKEDPLDFALWKAAKPGEPAWDSPWGEGRPGWHIECSAMSLKYLGHGFDIHGGGLDLIFPHHENEIAQSEAYTGETPFVRYWLHNGLINFGDEKMSKSLGNFITIDDVLDAYEPALIRHVMLHNHYRSPVDFSDEQIRSVKRGWERLNVVYRQLASVGEPIDIDGATKVGVNDHLLHIVRRTDEKFFGALADDFNTPNALAALFELVRDVRPFVREIDEIDDEGKVGLQLAASTMAFLGGDILGILSDGNESGEATTAERLDGDHADVEADRQLIDGLVRIIIDQRAESRRLKEWERADALRDALQSLGITLIDKPEGTEWTLKD